MQTISDGRFEGFSPSRPGRAFVARRQSWCALCDEKIERGEQIRPVGLNTYGHWQCIAEYVPPKSPKTRVLPVRVLSRVTELRRRVFWSVGCPRCGAEAGAACKEEWGARRLRNHVQRMRLYSARKRRGLVQASPVVLKALREALGRAVEPVERDEAAAPLAWRALVAPFLQLLAESRVPARAP